MVTLFTLKNLKSREALQVDFKSVEKAWRYLAEYRVPAQLYRDNDKEAYRDWCINAKTDHCFINLTEGVNPNGRISRNNEPDKIYGMVAEFDKGTITAEKLDRAFNRLNEACRPNLVCRTYSDYARAYWFFAEPVSYFSAKFWEVFCKQFWDVIQPDRMLPGWVEKESSDPYKYFEVGHDLEIWNDAPFPQANIAAIRKRAIDKVDWVKMGGRKLSEDQLRDLLAKKYPGRWPGGWENFRIGARSLCFWDETATDETACVVYENGCKRYTDDQPFVFWDEILDPQDVQVGADEMIGRRMEGIVYDHKNQVFLFRRKKLVWDMMGLEPLRQELRHRGASDKKEPHESESEIENILCTLRAVERIDGYATEFYKDEEFIHRDGKRLLNQSHLKLMEPHADKNAKAKGFPKLWATLQRMFDEEQLERFLAWLRHFYVSAYNRELVRGLGLILAGPAGCGKSFLVNGVMSPMFGCRATDAGSFVQGTDQFNGRIFTESPLIYVSDSVKNPFKGGKLLMSERVKSIVSNDWQQVRFMRQEGFLIRWLGRLIMLMNLDSNSLRNAPDLEISIRDKLLMLKADENPISPPTDPELVKELPFFCSFLLDSKTPDWIELDNRFGLKGWIEPTLRQDIQAQSPAEVTREIIEDWLEDIQKKPIYHEKSCWKGTCTKLYRELVDHEAVPGLIPDVVVLGMRLKDYCAIYPERYSKGRANGRSVYTIKFRQTNT